MVESSFGAEAAVSSAAQKELIKFKTQMDGLKERLAAAPDKEGKLREACKDFEAVFISKMWKEMKNTVPKGGVFGSKQSEMYMSMFDRDFAEKMADSGGIGLGDMLYDQLKDKLKQSSRDALAGKVAIKPLENGSAGIAISPADRGGVTPGQGLGNRTIDQWLGNESASVQGKEGLAEHNESVVDAALSDTEVKARLDALTRRIEGRRSASRAASSAYEESSASADDENIGRKLAQIG